VSSTVGAVLAAPGEPLDASTRTLMTSRFGHDFGRVRVHTDARAAQSAQALNAHAYTVGRDIVFNAGQYRPRTNMGKQLLAHELTHVMQQRHLDPAPMPQPLKLGPSHDRYEAAAEAHGGRLTAATPASLPPLSAPRVQRSAIGSFFSDLFSLSPGPFSAIYRLFGGENYSREELQAYLDHLAGGSIEDRYDSDNKARAVVGRQGEFKPLTTPIKILLIQEMLSGATLDADEKGILSLLRAASAAERSQMVQKIGRERLWDDFSGANRRALEAITLTAADFADPKLIDRLKALSPEDLAEYRDNALDGAVKSQIEQLLRLQKITTPLGMETAFEPGGTATLTIGGVAVRVQPDTTTDDEAWRDSAYTSIGLAGGTIEYIPAGDGTVKSVTNPGQITATMQTVYGPGARRTGPSGYGRGTTAEDVAAGTTSLGFHEGRHGLDFFEFLRNNPAPVLTGKAGDTVETFEKAMEDYGAAVTAYQDRLLRFSVEHTDCPGKPIPPPKLTAMKLSATLCEDIPQR
jgi:hypothetical protein